MCSEGVNVNSVKHLYIFHGILVDILCFGTHYAGGGEAEDGEGSFKELIIIKKKKMGAFNPLFFNLFPF